MAMAQESGDPDYLKWRERIIAAEKDRDSWFRRVEGIIKRYKDERASADSDRRKFNVLWSNTQTMRPALYGKQPTTLIERRFLDRDEVGRIASTIWERAVRYDLDDSSFHRAAKRAVLDYLLSGQGVMFVRYDAETADVPVDDTDDDETLGDSSDQTTGDAADAEMAGMEADASDPNAAPETEPKLLSQSICFDHINYKDFLTSKARTWDEVDWIAKRVYMSRGELEKRFGKERADKIDLHNSEDKENKSEGIKKAAVYEIWCKTSKEVYWLTKDDDSLLDEKPDPIEVRNFWPCAEPILTTTANDSVIPVPDYIQYQDQAQEIDNLTDRIDSLTSALKVAGVYDEAAGGLQRLLNEDLENQLIPVKNFAQFSGGQGMSGVISFLPTKEVADTLMALVRIREQMKKDLFEVTGISDIIRGQSDPDETLGAQKMKGQHYNMRLQDRQREVARWARDTIAIAAEIIAEQYSPETLIEKSGAMFDTGIVTIPETMPAPPGMMPAMPPQAPQGVQQGAPPQGMDPNAPQPDAGQQPPQGAPMAPPVIPAGPQMVPMTPDGAAQFKIGKLLEAITLLKNDKLRGFRIDIETDSTVEADAQEEKKSRVEFLTAVTTFLKQGGEIVQQHPEIGPLVGKMLLFGVRGYRTGRDLESSIEAFVEQMEASLKTKASQPQQQQPNLEMIKAQTEQARGQAEIQKAQTDAQATIAAAQLDAQTKAMEFQARQQAISQQMEFEAMKHQHRMDEIAAKKMAASLPPLQDMGINPDSMVPYNVG
jgi:hypothetical protein